MPIEPFENTAQAHVHLADLQKKVLPHLPRHSPVEVEYFHSEILAHSSRHGHWKYMIEGEWVGYADAFVPWWWSATNYLLCRIGVHPLHRKKGIGTALLKHLVAFAQSEGCVSLGGDVFDLYPDDIRFMEKYGFVLKQKDTCSLYDTRKPIPQNLKDVHERVLSSGIEILRGDLFAQRYPDEWKKKWWTIDRETVVDVPCPSERKTLPFAQWRSRLSSPSFNVREFFFALEGAHLVGLSGGVIFPGESTKGGVHFTGVLQSHRRKGLATALKVMATQHLIDAGVQEIVTNNEKDNPMLKLNEALGFEPAYACMFYQVEVASLLNHFNG